MATERTPDSWYQQEPEDLFRHFDSGPSGLDSESARTRLESHGPNELPQSPPPTFPIIFIRQFNNPLIYILGLAALIAAGIGEFVDAGFIVAVLVLNALIGSVQEWRAERSSLALQNLIRTKASVFRDGSLTELDSRDVVPGDVVWLESGQRVPADLRLIETNGLEVDESTLTGESLPVEKESEWTTDAPVSLGDRRNMAFAGSTVSRGRGRGLVVATGSDTEIGRLARDVSQTDQGKPPLLTRMERFTRVVGITVLVAAAFAATFGVVSRGYGAVEMFLFAVALAVSAIPEGLPVAMTVALGVATQRMAKRNVIVRRLMAVEGLGSCTMVATDKTGTLTLNELTVRRVVLPGGESYDVSGPGYEPEGEVHRDGKPIDPDQQDELARLARACVLANEGQLRRRDGEWTWHGDPTDVALLSLAHKLNWTREEALSEYPEKLRIPFEAERRYSASIHRVEGSDRIFLKGAPERILQMLEQTDSPSADREQLEHQAEQMAAEGYRVLALAEGTPGGDPDEVSPESPPEELTFLGFVGITDPLRPGVSDAIQQARKSGITVTMVTGDHPVTALSIARELGMAEDESEVMTGTELEALPPERRSQAIRQTRVFARVSPGQKLEVVNEARQAGHFVAVTGDGVNDAPALTAANIGVAMGKRGTDVARDAAELILSDDNFSSIVAGVEEGRIAYDNIRKVIYLLVSTGAAELVLILSSLFTGLPLPLTPVQLLWLNLVTNGIQDVALAFEPGESDVLDRKPRPTGERIFNPLMIERTLAAATYIGLAGLFTFQAMLAAGWSEPMARNGLLLLMVLFENVHIGNCRSETRSVLTLSPLKSPILMVGALTAFGLHVLFMHLPSLQPILEAAPVAPRQWFLFGIIALGLLVTMEIHKFYWNQRDSES